MKTKRRRQGRALRKRYEPECQLASECAKKRPSKLATRAKKKLIGTIDGVRVWTVDGPFIRDHLDDDFALASHDAHSKFIPKGEVWIEESLGGRDRDAIIAHELTERVAMLAGDTYEEGHDKARVVEQKMRRARG
jgi:hypothetical protein